MRIGLLEMKKILCDSGYVSELNWLKGRNWLGMQTVTCQLRSRRVLLKVVVASWQRWTTFLRNSDSHGVGKTSWQTEKEDVWLSIISMNTLSRSSVGKEAGLTCEVSSAVSVLLQDITLPTATAMGAGTVLTQLVTRAPHGAVIKVFSIKQKRVSKSFPLSYIYPSNIPSLSLSLQPGAGINVFLLSFTVLCTHTCACATVVAADDVSQRTSAGSSIRWSVTTMLAAQRGTFPDTWPMHRAEVNNWANCTHPCVLDTSCVATHCSCAQQWRWFRPLHQDSEVSHHTADLWGYTSPRMGRATLLGNTPAAHCLQTESSFLFVRA